MERKVAEIKPSCLQSDSLCMGTLDLWKRMRGSRSPQTGGNKLLSVSSNLRSDRCIICTTQISTSQVRQQKQKEEMNSNKPAKSNWLNLDLTGQNGSGFSIRTRRSNRTVFGKQEEGISTELIPASEA